MDVGDDEPSPVHVDPATLSRCADPSETTYRFDTEDAFAAALVGRWFRCRGQDTGALYFPGVEFSDRGWWWALEADGSGGYVRATDPARFGTYTTWGSSISMAFENAASQSLVVLFDSSKTRMNVIYSSQPLDVAYVHE